MNGGFALLKTARFLPLFTTQALGAINDNLFKNALVVLALYRLTAAGPILVALAGGVFILPYVLFSCLAGQLADRFEKSRLIRLTKYWELGLMIPAAAGFLTGNIAVLMTVLFGLGVQASFFSPLKYGMLPGVLHEDELIAGNGLIEAGTFIGILIGTIAGGVLITLPGGPGIVSAAAILVATAGVAAAYWVPATVAAAPALHIDWNLARETLLLLRTAAGNRRVWLAILGISWFWAVGATLLAEFPTIARDSLHANGRVVTLMLAVFSVGVGLGSVVCARLLHGEVTAKYVPLAALGISVFTLDFALAALAAGPLPSVHAVLGTWRGERMMADLLLLAACGGVYSVPLYALMQEHSLASHRSRMIAANNVINAVAMCVAAVLTAITYIWLRSAPDILLLTALSNGGVALWMWRWRR